MTEIRTYLRQTVFEQIEQSRWFEPGQAYEVAVQAHISNISFPRTLEELDRFIYVHGRYNLEDILSEEATGWTAPKWTKVGDIVFFMHSKCSSIETIRRLENQVKKEKKDVGLENDAVKVMEWLQRGRELHSKYGGKIFAIARAVNLPRYENFEGDRVYHFKGRIYVDFEDVMVLDNPIDISEFRDYIMISRVSGITPLFGKSYLTLKKAIMDQNKVPDWFASSVSSPIPLHQIDPSNWMEVGLKHRRSFFLEVQYREYFVNYLLNEIFPDLKTYTECLCFASDQPICFIDNVIKANGSLVLVEVKLNVRAESNLYEQLTKYASSTHLKLSKDSRKIVNDSHEKMLVIDTEALYTFSPRTQILTPIFMLDDLSEFTLPQLKQIIAHVFDLEQQIQ